MPSDVQVEINGDVWGYWSSVTIRESADSVAAISLTASFEPGRERFRDTFRPFAYNQIVVYLDGQVRFVGTMMSVSPSVTNDESTVTVEGYAKCGLLGDITAKPEQFPTEFKGLKLEQIARQLAEPFGVDVVFDTDPGSVFEKVQLKPGQKILDLLIKLAKQRAIIISSDPNGALRFYKANANTADVVAELSEDRPVLSVSTSFNVQDYFSSLTGISKAKSGKKGSRFTVENTLLAGLADRPYVYELSDTDAADVPQAVEARVGRMFADSVAYDVEVATVRDKDGFFWEPNHFIAIKYPRAMIYNRTPLLIRTSELTFTPNSNTARLNCILPGSLSGTLPEVLPWDELLNF